MVSDERTIERAGEPHERLVLSGWRVTHCMRSTKSGVFIQRARNCRSDSNGTHPEQVEPLVENRRDIDSAATDAVTSTTNQETSTNSAVTLSAGTVNEPQTVAANSNQRDRSNQPGCGFAGDLIIIKLERATDTATADAALIADSAEVSET